LMLGLAKLYTQSLMTSRTNQQLLGLDPRELPDNPDPRLLCVVLLDVSESMSGAPIDELNRGLQAYQLAIQADKLTSGIFEIALVTFGGTVQVVQPFVEARYFKAPTLRTEGDTPMAPAVLEGIRLITDRQAELKGKGIAYYRPWLWLFTIGKPNDSDSLWRAACEAVQTGESSAFSFFFFSVGVGAANLAKLGELSTRQAPVALASVDFREFFAGLSFRSRPEIPPSIVLPPPDWTNIKL
jgi:uncharacterized protein YegL